MDALADDLRLGHPEPGGRLLDEAQVAVVGVDVGPLESHAVMVQLVYHGDTVARAGAGSGPRGVTRWHAARVVPVPGPRRPAYRRARRDTTRTAKGCGCRWTVRRCASRTMFRLTNRGGRWTRTTSGGGRRRHGGAAVEAAPGGAGMRAPDFAAAVKYGEDLVYKVESGKRIPRPEYLEKADEVLGAGGLIAAMKEDVAKVRYPKRVRELAKLESQAVEIGLYSNHNVHGLLQTEEHMRALFDVWLPRPYGGRDGAHGRSPVGPAVGLREVTGADAELRSGGSDAPPSGRGHNGVASAARTPAGTWEVAARVDPGDADRGRGPLRNGRAADRQEC